MNSNSTGSVPYHSLSAKMTQNEFLQSARRRNDTVH